MTLTTVSPVTAPRWYGYFQTVTGVSGVGSPGGRVTTQAELTWFGLPSSRVLILARRETPLPDLGGVTQRRMQEWVVVVDDDAALPRAFDTVGGLDPQGQPYPAYGVFVRLTHQFAVSGLSSADYLPRQSAYATTELLNQPDSLNAPIGLMASGVREVISHLDNAAWDGPGSLIVYDRESSFGWVTRSDVPDFDLTRSARWVPGKAGVYERFLLGTGTLDGWALYALQNVLVVEFWRAGVLLSSRVLRCDSLAPLLADPDPTFVLGFGYDLEAGLLSIGCAGRGDGGAHSALAFTEYRVPELRGLQHEHRAVYVGGAPFLYQDGQQADRTAWGYVQPVQGQFTSEGYLTRGSLTRLMQEV